MAELTKVLEYDRRGGHLYGMSGSDKLRVALFLGAGWSFLAGLPLARQLFEPPVVAYTRDVALRLETVLRSYEQWTHENPRAHPEEFIAAAHAHRARLVAVEDERLPARLRFDVLEYVPWEWVVEFVQVRLAAPVAGETRRAPTRYAPQMHMPTRSAAQQDFWLMLQHTYAIGAVVTTNYDLLAERTMRHRQMRRPPSPGFHYGGVAAASTASRAPFGRERRTDPNPHGLTPLFKLHGSLNWALRDSTIEVFPDPRPAFRARGSAAIVPPLPEKQAPTWLRPVWEGAEVGLAEADVWVVVGYSLPPYDEAVRDLLMRSARAGNVRHIDLFDPHAAELASRWASLAGHVEVRPHAGLPRG